MRRFTANARLLPLAVLVALVSPCLAQIPEKERKMGQEASAEIDKAVKLVTDEATLDRVNTIGKRIAAITEYPDAPWTFKVIDEKDVNAFSLPGGYIYLYKGILMYCQTDDELAAVLAHEIAHVTRHHAVQRDKVYQKGAKPIQLITLLALILAGNNGSAQDVAIGASYAANWANLARVMTYSRQAELESDDAALGYLSKAGYRPVAAYTLMRRMARDNRLQPNAPEMSIFQTHPPSEERRDKILAELKRMGFPTDRAAQRSVTTENQVIVQVVEGRADQRRLLINNEAVLIVTDALGKSAEVRANEIQQAINRQVFDEDLLSFRVVVKESTKVYAREELLYLACEEDARANSVELDELAPLLRRALVRALDRLSLDG